MAELLRKIASCQLPVASSRTGSGQLHLAFTLVELMVSIALVLILMVGVSWVFRMASDTVMAGQTAGEESRGLRALQAAMGEDLRSCLPDSPVFVISSMRVTQHSTPMNRLRYYEFLGVRPFDYDINGNGVIAEAGVPGEAVGPHTFSPHTHRSDMLRFFASGRHLRQTADDGSFASGTVGGEAYISYGHANRQTGAYDGNRPSSWPLVCEGPEYMYKWDPIKSFPPPPDPPYRTGYTRTWFSSALASTNVLARNALLLRDSATLRGGGNTEAFIARENQAPAYWAMGWPQVAAPGNPAGYPVPQFSHTFHPLPSPDPPGTVPTINLTPIGYGSRLDRALTWPGPSPDGSGGSRRRFEIQESRVDLVEGTLADMRRWIGEAQAQEAAVRAAYPRYSCSYPTWPRVVRWWHPLVFVHHPLYVRKQLVNPPAMDGGYVSDPPLYYLNRPAYVTVPNPWGGQIELIYGDSGCFSFRFAYEPRVPNPLTSQAAAQSAPWLLGQCSSFAVEYAGDYLTQEATGLVTAVGADGEVDFLVRTIAGKVVKQVRWYGLPRDVDGDGVILGWGDDKPDADPNTATSSLSAGRTANQMVDVVPLRDVARTAPGQGMPGATYFNGLPFERDTRGLIPAESDYGKRDRLYQMPADWDAVRTRAWSRYICIWENDVPAMVRVIARVDDMNDRLNEGQRGEWVFRLK